MADAIIVPVLVTLTSGRPFRKSLWNQAHFELGRVQTLGLLSVVSISSKIEYNKDQLAAKKAFQKSNASLGLLVKVGFVCHNTSWVRLFIFLEITHVHHNTKFRHTSNKQFIRQTNYDKVQVTHKHREKSLGTHRCWIYWCQNFLQTYQNS